MHWTLISPRFRSVHLQLDDLAAKGTPAQAKIAVDGIFGPNTKAATQAFQRWAHITVDGIVGVDTYTAAAQALG